MLVLQCRYAVIKHLAPRCTEGVTQMQDWGLVGAKGGHFPLPEGFFLPVLLMQCWGNTGSRGMQGLFHWGKLRLFTKKKAFITMSGCVTLTGAWYHHTYTIYVVK